MRRVLPFVMILIIPFSASAQNWTPEQQEVIAQIKACWDAWRKANEQKDYTIWEKACPCIDDAPYWVTIDGAPMSSDFLPRGAKGLFSWDTKRFDWLDLRPLAIRIDGDVALVQFYALWLVEDDKGDVNRIEQKRFEVFRKKNGKWTFIGGMVAPVSKE